MAATKISTECNKCGAGPFKNSQGLHLHNLRKHTIAGKTWGSTKGTRVGGVKSDTCKSVRGYLIQVLGESEGGLSLTEAIKKMQQIGYKGNNAGYISTLASNDPKIMRLSHGAYALKEKSETPLKPALAKPELTAIDLPKEALLATIEMLGTQVRALRTAHIGFVREVIG